MIRLIAKNPDGLAFDPIASLLFACGPIFKGRGAMRVDYEYGGVKGSWNVDGTYQRTLDPEQLASIMRESRVALGCDIVLKDGSARVDITLVNDLTCVPASVPDSKGRTNGDFGVVELWYAEAENPGKPRSAIMFDPSMSGMTASCGRPYYGVVITKVSTNYIEAHGPLSTYAEQTYLCTDTSVGSGLQIFATSGSVPVNAMEPGTVMGVVSNDEQLVDERVFNFITPDNERVPVALTQAAVMLDGRVLNYVDYLRVIQMICLYEHMVNTDDSMFLVEIASFANEAGGFDLPIRQTGGRWYLDARLTDLWAAHCSENAWVRSLFSNVKATDDELFLCDNSGDKLGSISRQSDSQSCYALSFAYVLSLGTGGSMSNIIAALKSAVDPSFGIKTDGKYIVANQNVWGSFVFRDADGGAWNVHKSGRGLAKPSKKRGESYDSQFDIKWLVEECGEDGVFVLGYDPDTTKPANSRGDHFIVCRIRGGRAFVEFDPYRVEGSTTFARYGADVTNSIDSFHEACVHVFKLEA